MATWDATQIPIDSTDQAVLSCRAGVGRAGTCRAGAGLDVSMLRINVGNTDHGTFKWQRVYGPSTTWITEES